MIPDFPAARRIALRALREVFPPEVFPHITTRVDQLLAEDGPCADCAARPLNVLPAGLLDPRCCESAARRAGRGET